MPEENPLDKANREFREKVTALLKDRLLAIYETFHPVWNARADVLKTLVSLSSASIVLSVGFSSSLLSQNAGLFWRYLILFSFVMFGLSLCTALGALWIGIHLHAVRIEVTKISPDMKVASKQLDVTKLTHDLIESGAVTQPFDPLMDSLEQTIQRKETPAGLLSMVSFVAFAAAVLSLIAVGFRQLLP